jgi:hypothetical protein
MILCNFVTLIVDLRETVLIQITYRVIEYELMNII